jgi:hypothetical protein
MRIDRFVAFYVVALSFFMVGPALGQPPAKSVAKSITVYKTPT